WSDEEGGVGQGRTSGARGWGAPDGQRCGITDRVAAIGPACAIDQQFARTQGRRILARENRATAGGQVRRRTAVRFPAATHWHVAHGANSTARAPATKRTRWERGAT